MTIIAGQGDNQGFAKIPETHIFSDFISDTGLHILAIIDRAKRDHTAWRNRSMKWPIITITELAEILQVSDNTVKREIAKLKKLGLIAVTKTTAGNRYELLSPKLATDTFRNRETVSARGHAQVTWATLTCGISSGALRLWMILDRIKGKHEWAYASQTRLGNYLGVSERTVIRYLNELRELGLVKVRRRESFGMNEYQPISYEEARREANEGRVRPTRIIVTLWLEASLGEEWMAWAKEHYDDVVVELWNVVQHTVDALGYDGTNDIVRGVIDQHGYGCPPDFLIKILDEILEDLDHAA